jgi:hypothetical protein
MVVGAGRVGAGSREPFEPAMSGRCVEAGCGSCVPCLWAKIEYAGAMKKKKQEKEGGAPR